MLTDDAFVQLVTLTHEIREVEFKPPGPRTSAYHLAMVARACLALSNLQGGGHVIIGMSETAGAFVPVGLSDEDCDSWLQYDATSDSINKYADPPMQLDVRAYTYNEKTFIVIEVREFDEIPILCRIDYNEQGRTRLRAGACYVRSQRKPASTEVPTQTEMRELLNLAIDKGVARFVARAIAGGFALSRTPAPTDEEKFREQRRELGE